MIFNPLRKPHQRIDRPVNLARRTPGALRTVVLSALAVSACHGDPVFHGETTAFQLLSKSVGDSFEISVHTPVGYPVAGTRYPVAYVLDGSVHSGPVAAITEDEGIEAIVIGVGYDDGRSPQRRNRDYTPTRDPAYPTSGGAAAFFAFVRDELVPRVDGDYPTEPGKRALLGHSFGGIASLYVAFTQDRAAPLFPTVIASSPSLWWDDGVFFDYEQQLANQGTDLGLRLYVSAGGFEYALINALAGEMVRRLRSRSYPGLQIRHEQADDEVHGTAWRPGFREGVRFAFGR